MKLLINNKTLLVAINTLKVGDHFIYGETLYTVFDIEKECYKVWGYKDDMAAWFLIDTLLVIPVNINSIEVSYK